MSDPKSVKPKAPKAVVLGIAGNLETAIQAAPWLTDSDAAAVEVLKRLALSLDVAFNEGDVKEIPTLAKTFLGYLQQCRLTVETRATAKQGEENNGNGHIENYLRLYNPTA